MKKWMFVPIVGLLLLLAGCGAEQSARMCTGIVECEGVAARL